MVAHCYQQVLHCTGRAIFYFRPALVLALYTHPNEPYCVQSGPLCRQLRPYIIAGELRLFGQASTLLIYNLDIYYWADLDFTSQYLVDSPSLASIYAYLATRVPE